jgi:hypothetical protein
VSEAFYSSRRATGIVVSLERRDDGRFRIVFDDVERSMFVDATGWTLVSPYTWIEVDGSKLDPLTLSETELAEVGFNLLNRLAVLAKNDA